MKNFNLMNILNGIKNSGKYFIISYFILDEKINRKNF